MFLFIKRVHRRSFAHVFRCIRRVLRTLDTSVVKIERMISCLNATRVDRTIGLLFAFRIKYFITRNVSVTIIRAWGPIRIVRVFHTRQAQTINRLMTSTTNIDPRAFVKRFSFIGATSTYKVGFGLFFSSYPTRRHARSFFNEEKATSITRAGRGCSLFRRLSEYGCYLGHTASMFEVELSKGSISLADSET